MTRSLEQIERDQAQLVQAVTELAARIREVYDDYLNALGNALPRQLAQASYQICTHGYPEAFLRLRGDQREQLQKDLRQLGKQARAAIVSAGSALPSTEPDGTSANAERAGDDEASLATESGELRPDMLEAALGEQIQVNPEALMLWCQAREQRIAQTLKSLSGEANTLLQTAGVLPGQVPKPVLAAAVDADESEAGSDPPNTLSFVLEVPGKDESARATDGGEEPEFEDREVPAVTTPIAAIRLRLVEIEFADPDLSAQRADVRSLLERLSPLRRRARDLRRARSVARAEAAWRATWFED
ncbi:hypothetical protein KR51_00013410 [Rubidibacter lacunae KORDI 51-2]|uniref:Uncharacterized protein n=1 Tax=Rubidibacter lacunae KORDI 51-2 TaxID=582515 RepID=U5DMA8_9CHRO|nr:hypothetical protein [Rubidibacter lacunae]ERN42007.1 hypothetical protein KR51_00013410 [Rubidibacter lacunae KORDI 51-2]